MSEFKLNYRAVMLFEYVTWKYRGKMIYWQVDPITDKYTFVL